MHMHAALDLQNFPDSPYASELRRRFPRLQFAAPLEREFQAMHLPRMRARVRGFQLALCALAVALALQLLLLEENSLLQLACGWLGLVIPASLFMLWAAFSRRYTQLYLPLARWAVPLTAIASAIGIAAHSESGASDQFYFLTIYCIGLFFVGGQLFRESLLNAGVLVLVYGLTLIYNQQPAGSVVYCTLVLAIAATTGGCIYYGVEQQARTSFLERGLLGEMVMRDSLTGLKNRGAFDECFARIWQQRAREGHALAVLLIDVDHFKAYNDRYGHQAGDDALRRVAQVVQRFARRPLDIAARYGGEEFVLALYDPGVNDVRAIAHELCAAIREVAILHEDSPTAAVVTVSIGMAQLGARPTQSPEGLVHSADKALYRAKRQGRNSVACLDDGVSHTGPDRGSVATDGDDMNLRCTA